VNSAFWVPSAFAGSEKKKGDLFQIYIKAFGGIGKIRSVPPER
jgi:hypothetical protein